MTAEKQTQHFWLGSDHGDTLYYDGGRSCYLQMHLSSWWILWTSSNRATIPVAWPWFKSVPQDFIGLEYFQVLCSDRQDDSLCATAEYFGHNCSRLVIIMCSNSVQSSLFPCPRKHRVMNCMHQTVTAFAQQTGYFWSWLVYYAPLVMTCES